jgi:hypothetical protein
MTEAVIDKVKTRVLNSTSIQYTNDSVPTWQWLNDKGEQVSLSLFGSKVELQVGAIITESRNASFMSYLQSMVPTEILPEDI